MNLARIMLALLCCALVPLAAGRADAAPVEFSWFGVVQTQLNPGDSDIVDVVFSGGALVSATSPGAPDLLLGRGHVQLATLHIERQTPPAPTGFDFPFTTSVYGSGFKIIDSLNPAITWATADIDLTGLLLEVLEGNSVAQINAALAVNLTNVVVTASPAELAASPVLQSLAESSSARFVLTLQRSRGGLTERINLDSLTLPLNNTYSASAVPAPEQGPTVPEPAGAALLGATGLVALARRRTR